MTGNNGKNAKLNSIQKSRNQANEGAIFEPDRSNQALETTPEMRDRGITEEMENTKTMDRSIMDKSFDNNLGDDQTGIDKAPVNKKSQDKNAKNKGQKEQ